LLVNAGFSNEVATMVTQTYFYKLMDEKYIVHPKFHNSYFVYITTRTRQSCRTINEGVMTW